jgi:tRNA1(Val) A37 N6-methylase TrmN6
MRARVCFEQGDTFSPPTHVKREFAHVFSNPPFHGDEGEASPNPTRERALHDTGRFADWLRAGLKRTVSGGTLTAIFRADRLGEALQALPERGVAVLPLWPRADEAAKRVIVQIRKGSGAALTLLPGLILHEADGRFTPEADEILRGGASLALGKPRL